jgi:hypothetical protein
MSYTKSDYEGVMKRPDSGWAKYGGSTQNCARVLQHLLNNQYIPSVTSLNRTIRELGIKRTDGKSAADDAREMREAAQAHFDAVCAEAQRIPLSPEELREFGSLSQLDLSKKYFAEDGDYFRIRYDLACRIHGFRPARRFASVTAEQEDGEGLQLTAAQYHAIPANQVAQRLRTDLKFKQAVYVLLSQGKI